LRPAVRPHALAFRSLWATLGDITVALAAVLVISLSAPVWGSETEAVAPTRFLMMSDIHFDPMDPKLVDRLSSTEPEEWRAIFESSDNKSPAPVWCRQQLGAAALRSRASKTGAAEPCVHNLAR
jgi:hypothetical protein